VLNNFENAGLEILHDGVGPEAGVLIEAGGEALAAGEVKEDVPVGKRFETVFAIEDIEVTAPDADVLVEGCGRNVSGVGMDSEGEPVFGIPCGDGFDEEETMLKAGMTDAAYAFGRDGGFDGTGKADAVGPVGLEFVGGNGGDTCDSPPDYVCGSMYPDLA
jgi:hypothetical protein